MPYDPDFEKKIELDERNVLAWHDRLLALRGGVVGVRDVGLLKSVLVRPQQHVVYGDAPDTVHLAAIYDGARGSRGY